MSSGENTAFSYKGTPDGADRIIADHRLFCARCVPVWWKIWVDRPCLKLASV